MLYFLIIALKKALLISIILVTSKDIVLINFLSNLVYSQSQILEEIRYYKSRNNSKGLNCYLIGVRIELLAKRTDQELFRGCFQVCVIQGSKTRQKLIRVLKNSMLLIIVFCYCSLLFLLFLFLHPSTLSHYLIETLLNY